MEKNIIQPWAELLAEEMQKDYFLQLWQFVEAEYAAGTCYPPAPKIFAALNECPPSQVKAVILGQDPYHEEGQAEGLSFSFGSNQQECSRFAPVCFQPSLFDEPFTATTSKSQISNLKPQTSKRWPPSLKNILREVSDDTGAPIPSSGSLLRWAHQGVLLLNATLTVRQGQANSHSNHGWEQFTDAIISIVNANCAHAVFFLWGSYAQKKAALIDASRHLVLQSVHPSPLSAHRGFFGNHQFTKANTFLRSHGQKEITW
ncbi:MAG: uracil-DNA glycosylase [Bacteroidaceae bacterium]|nr:uracil-DNA glycosylase [Bacteroidaceae bacterium]